MPVRRGIPVSVLELLTLITENHEFVLRSYFGIECEPRTRSQIGVALGVGRSRISQILDEGIATLGNLIRFRRLIVVRAPLDEDTFWEVQTEVLPVKIRMCSACWVQEPLVEIGAGRTMCRMCIMERHRKRYGMKLACKFPGYKRMAWWALYPDAPNAEKGRAAYFARRGSPSKRRPSALKAREDPEK